MRSSEETNVTRRQSIVNVTVTVIALIIFTALIMLTIYSLDKEEPVYAKSVCPYDIVVSSEKVEMEKTFNKDKDKWESFDVYVYKYKFDGVPGIYIDCPELDKTLDLYGYSDYEVLKFEKTPSFNIKIDNKLYIHPEQETGTFMIVD